MSGSVITASLAARYRQFILPTVSNFLLSLIIRQLGTARCRWSAMNRRNIWLAWRTTHYVPDCAARCRWPLWDTGARTRSTGADAGIFFARARIRLVQLATWSSGPKSRQDGRRMLSDSRSIGWFRFDSWYVSRRRRWWQHWKSLERRNKTNRCTEKARIQVICWHGQTWLRRLPPLLICVTFSVPVTPYYVPLSWRICYAGISLKVSQSLIV